MKKLMMALGAVATACSLQAASFVWGFANAETVAKDGKYFGDGAYANASAFLYLGTVSLSDGKFDFGSATLLASVQGMNSDFNWGDFTAPGSTSNDAVLAAGGQSYTLILVDKGGVTDLNRFDGNAILAYGTSGHETIPGAGETLYYASFTNDTQYGAAAWQAVPEPTSGLLLLLGVAGLALRRKRA